MNMQPSLNPEMRAILIDWLVEVQVSFPGLKNTCVAAQLDTKKTSSVCAACQLDTVLRISLGEL